ncbi:HAD family hydrolase [Parabacteroides faecis]|uniref:Phosphoglycolate phosphatase n=1 Tax=Parabacteroides faecis TaxID=1217282 RepID=A0ABR6KSC6_9BACT|nr:HAD family hydrolase [Parabacteroides faecis]MBB4624406.1 phosphoglycolate phosphatase [Parabacteroides faecis]GGK03406.1 phosphoglycolate phosphatase [Parabacteroides faecis]
MKQYKYLLFDLDGTITDSETGITRCVAYALNYFGIQVNDLRELSPFIGPPLLDSFKDFYNFTDEQATVAVAKYRERYADKGILENELYPGIEELLADAQKNGRTVILATSKPEIFAKRILDHFGLSDYFSFVAGSGLDGSLHTKTDVINYILQSNQITNLESVVMIGDRKHDIIGAKNVGIDSIGVLYGFGDYKELSDAGADHIAENIPALRKLLL